MALKNRLRPSRLKCGLRGCKRQVGPRTGSNLRSTESTAHHKDALPRAKVRISVGATVRRPSFFDGRGDPLHLARRRKEWLRKDPACNDALVEHFCLLNSGCGRESHFPTAVRRRRYPYDRVPQPNVLLQVEVRRVGANVFPHLSFTEFFEVVHPTKDPGHNNARIVNAGRGQVQMPIATHTSVELQVWPTWGLFTSRRAEKMPETVMREVPSEAAQKSSSGQQEACRIISPYTPCMWLQPVLHLEHIIGIRHCIQGRLRTHEYRERFVYSNFEGDFKPKSCRLSACNAFVSQRA